MRSREFHPALNRRLTLSTLVEALALHAMTADWARLPYE
jgi:hypothetical protein